MNPDRFGINQMTVKQLPLPDLVRECVRLGIPGVGLWREPVQEYGVEAAADLVRDAGLAVTTLCRGGFFTSDGWEAANRAAIDEAVTLGTDTLVLVSGGLTPACPDLPSARARITEAIGELAPYAGERGVRLAIEPLHPMYASDRCAVSTLDQALEIAEHFPASQVGVTVDTYHLWWDDRAPAAVDRAGAAGRIHSFQLADWTTPSRPESSTAGANWARARSTWAPGPPWWRRPATRARSRWNSSTTTCGRGTACRSWRRRWRRSWRCDETWGG